MKNDGQQRNWTVHDDDEIITEYLEELLSILVSKCQLKQYLLLCLATTALPTVCLTRPVRFFRNT